MSATLSSDNWGIHAPAFYERNYACDDHVYSQFGGPWVDLNKTGAHSFQKQLYFCNFDQALGMKQRIEQYRSQNAWGILIWQFNEVWPTGGWGSIEYGTPRPGQVIG